MIIRALVENTSTSEIYRSEHGLSLYIETNSHKILFDTGASAVFTENARKMGVNLREVDLAVISHGHYDHGGGIRTFLNINEEAKVYIKENVFVKHYATGPVGKKTYIGLDQALLPNDRFAFVGEGLAIDDKLELFSQVTSERLNPTGNRDLLMEINGLMVPDDFAHEQNLIIEEGENTVLIAGCAHKGIVNILEHFRMIRGHFPSHVIAGFHLYNPAANKYEDPAVVAEVGAYLLGTGAKFYTGHCTGIESYERLKTILGEKIDYMSTGSLITI